MLVLAAIFAAAAPTSPGCLDASQERDIPVHFTGRLERRVFAGPPNYGEGPNDSRETAYILVLDGPVCLNEDVGMGAPRTPFRRVHVFTGRDALRPRLYAAVGHRIEISGRAFGAHTAHHREPLVVDIDSLQIRR